MSRVAWDEFSKIILVRYVLSYLCGTLYFDPSVSLKRIFAFSAGGLFSLSTHALTCLRRFLLLVLLYIGSHESVLTCVLKKDFNKNRQSTCIFSVQ